jgi:methionyl-tRNA synthetase
MHFTDLDLRIGKVKAVKDHPNADKLYIILVDLGKVERDLQIVSGMRDYYKKEDLLGKKIVILRNLKPAVFRGIESNGMLLAALDGETLGLLVGDKSKPGAKIIVEESEDEPEEQLTFSDWQKIKITVSDNHPIFDGKKLKTEKEEISLDKSVIDGTVVG